MYLATKPPVRSTNSRPCARWWLWGAGGRSPRCVGETFLLEVHPRAPMVSCSPEMMTELRFPPAWLEMLFNRKRPFSDVRRNVDGVFQAVRNGVFARSLLWARRERVSHNAPYIQT